MRAVGGNTKEANLIGIEYIVSERLFDSLPEAEQPFWLGIDEAAERAQRAGLAELVDPPRGVDAMADEFSGTTPIPGVVDAT